MEEISQSVQPMQPISNFAVHIEGDRSGFVSKSAIDKFKTGIKSCTTYNLEEFVNKYVKQEFELVQVSKSETEIKFTINQKLAKVQTKSESNSNDLKKKLRDKYYNRKNLPKETQYSIGQEKSSDIIKDVIVKLQEKRLSHRIINITNVLNPDTYVEYQKANYFTNIIMVAERNSSNESVFIPRSNSDKSNIMVMYHGTFRTFNYDLMNLVIDSVLEIIN